MRTIQCPKCTAYGQGDYPTLAALPNHRTAYAPDTEFELVESRNDPDLCPASEHLVPTTPITNSGDCAHAQKINPYRLGSDGW